MNVNNSDFRTEIWSQSERTSEKFAFELAKHLSVARELGVVSNVIKWWSELVQVGLARLYGLAR